MPDSGCEQVHRTWAHPLRFAVGLWVFLIASSLVLSAGCASKQEVETRAQRQRTEHFECLPDRWEEPPKEIGQTPPDSAPNARDVDPFLETNSKSQD